MKNLLIYISPNGIEGENGRMLKIQIENSLDLGWKLEDIILITNFSYEYGGVKSRVVPDELYCDFWKQQSKINSILYLFDKGLIENELYWFHDLDAFQTVPITISIDKDIVFTDYGYPHARIWNTGSFFFNKSAEKTLRMITERVYKDKTDEELALRDLINEGFTDYGKINISYNFPGSKGGEKYFELIYNNADKPVKVIHFHPERRGGRFFRLFCGENSLGIKLMPDRLINIFNKHGYGSSD
mgnify:CR=1 FL=1